MSLQSEQVKQWRRGFKKRIVDSMGGCCQICGYDKCEEALELHHIDPNEKDFSISKIRANCKAWVKVTTELRKCILLCANCHREVHNNKAVLPEQYTKFNEEFADYKFKQHYNKCPLCDKNKLKSHKYCSTQCSSHSRQKLDWSIIDLESLYKDLKTKIAVAKHLSVSEVTIRKRLKRLGIV
jgi:hypothetical protein